jgi:hypothetical protein
VCTYYIDSFNYLIKKFISQAFSDADSAIKVHGLQQAFLEALKCGDEISTKEVVLHKSIQSLEVLGTVWRIFWERLGDCFEDCFRERFGEYLWDWFG